MLDEIKPLARTSLSDGIVDQITALIARGVLKPGDRMPSEKQLCTQFGVGRTSVREALRSLSVLGVIESYAGDGHFVASDSGRSVQRGLQIGLLLDPRKAQNLIETRLMLETHNAALAANRATPEDIAEISRCLDGMRSSVQDYDAYLDFDLRFHLAVARATQNSILASLLAAIRAHLQSWISDTLASRRRRRAELSIEEHRRILDAIQRGKPEAARRAMRDHVLSSGRDL